MLALLSRRYYWPKMEYDVEAYVRTCLVCQLDKSERKREARLSMYGVFIPAPNSCPAETAADLFFKHVTERMNQLLEEYLRHYVSASQKNWVELLDMAQFCYNLHKSSATGMSPFELVYELQPMTPHEIAAQRTGGKSPVAYHFAMAKQDLLEEAKDILSKAQRRIKKYADLGRRDVEFSVGENVLLKLTPQIWKKISSKMVQRGLIPKYDGPFEILKKVGNVAYRLRLPDRLKIHPTIHVSFLKKYHEDALKETRKQVAWAPPVIRQEFDKDVQRILSHRTKGQSKKNRRTKYLVHWKGESEEDATWERDVTLWQFEKKIDDVLGFSAACGISRLWAKFSIGWLSFSAAGLVSRHTGQNARQWAKLLDSVRARQKNGAPVERSTWVGAGFLLRLAPDSPHAVAELALSDSFFLTAEDSFTREDPILSHGRRHSYWLSLSS
ncbi:hypothetical protein BUALT_Bualt10G0046300 [Buddleja alternifolia]|uniref:Chromo domain-containing protein n=1 Tax=Buddleja alternifolia TaxID=168488 RepID=A0AAV6X6Z5_9LAMI|nr:hypothetical protein BUALT_Bualt10G0046300 [Buddleja alternifolia]